MSKILIVDDEPDVIRVVGMRLKAEGHKVVTASDGATATRVAIREQPDMIILDIGMPAGDGHMVAERLQSNERTRTIPVLFLSARTAQEEIRKSQAVGAVGYLTKPYSPAELLSYVRNALPSE